jgi:phosphatidate cytidylyltransferase
MGTLTKRVLFAIPAIAFLLFANFWQYTFLFKAIAVLGLGAALYEFLNLADRRKMKTLRVEGLLALGLILLPWLLRPYVTLEGRGFYLIPLWILLFSFFWSNRPLKEMVVSVSVTFFGAVYFGYFGSYFFRLRELPDGAWHLFWLFAATWAYDTGGYFIGTHWGRHRLAPHVSPHKSWEGCAGGFILTTITLLLLWKFSLHFSQIYSLFEVLALSLLLSVFGQLGDLMESVIKRSLSAKDSGSFLPGHGGVFDRIDSLLFNAPILFYYLILFKK